MIAHSENFLKNSTAESPQQAPAISHRRAKSLLYDGIYVSNGCMASFREELGSYKLSSDHLLHEEKDPLVWWKTHQTQLPILAKQARNLLAIPASSSASERVFSITKRIIQGRCKMSKDNFSMLSFVSYNKKIFNKFRR